VQRQIRSLHGFLVPGEDAMDAEAFVQAMFKAEPDIRYIAIVNSSYEILISNQREGKPSLTSEETTRNFISIIPQIIVEAVEKLSPFLGKVDGITAHYEKVLVIFYRVGDLIVVMSFERDQPTPFYNRVTKAFLNFSSRYLA
jgi:hypothetical protein